MACDGIIDEPVNYRMAQRSWEMLRKLESWDVCFSTDEKGEYEEKAIFENWNRVSKRMVYFGRCPGLKHL
jgi:succinate dehydrogenase/fumarate reductase flavoprotein subunit